MATDLNPLLYADSETSSDALYFGRVGVPDPFVAFGTKGRKFAIVSALEFGRVKRESEFDKVLALEAYVAKAKKAFPRRKAGAAEVIASAARHLKIRHFTVPGDFPASIYHKLRQLGLKIDIAEGPLFPARELKSAAEIAALREGNRCSALGIGAGERVLKASTIRGGKLYFRGEVLTSERLKIAIETACLQAGAVSSNTIAAGGKQACDPHHRGSGPLRANELIILDVFPRVTATGYFGDMTRTFLRGRASEAQRALVAAVRAAQQAALATIRTGVTGQEVHAQACAVFKARGFKTKKTAKGSVGFFHGTGHGVGLAIHEPPRMGATTDTPLKRGAVVTVEPGLYYPNIGGCRIEDVIQVTDKGVKLLSDFHYDWEIR